MCLSIHKLLLPKHRSQPPKQGFVLPRRSFNYPSKSFIWPIRDFICLSRNFNYPRRDFFCPNRSLTYSSRSFICPRKGLISPSKGFICPSRSFKKGYYLPKQVFHLPLQGFSSSGASPTQGGISFAQARPLPPKQELHLSK